MALAVGTELGGYRIERLLGRGGMGEVYLAEQLGLHRRVALKLLAPALADERHFRERFVRESELAAALDHPNIVPIYEAGEVDGRLFLAMRYVDGPSLEAVLGEGPLTVERTLAILGGIAAALDAAHGTGLVHRDVKPANILLAAGSEHPYLADFGLTKHATYGGGLTAPGQLVGSADYVAPEQIEGRSVDGRADVYALACVLYACLAGEPPYRRDSELATLWAHVQAERPRLSAVRPELAALDPVIARGMATDPDGRYGSAGELTRAASDALATSSPVRTIIDGSASAKLGASGGTRTSLATRLIRSGRFVSRPAILAAAVGGLSMIVVSTLLLSGSQTPAPSPKPSTPGSSAIAVAPVQVRSRDRIAWYQEFPSADLGSPCSTDPFYTAVLEARLWMMDSDGRNQIAILPTADLWQRQPAWRPDGRSILFVTAEQNAGQPLWTIDADATNPKRLEAYSDPFGAASSDPAWSKDGKQIAFIDAGAVVTTNSDGSGRVDVRQQTKTEEPSPGASPPPGDAYHAPSWMPDGRIAIVRRDAGSAGPPPDQVPEGPGSLFAMNPDGSEYQPFLGLQLNTLDVGSASWSPDGNRVALSARTTSSGQQIWLVNSDGTGLRQLTKDGESISPAWSPDGSSIAFASSRDSHFEIYTIAADGSGQQRLTSTGGSVANCSPAWGSVDPGIATPVTSSFPPPGPSVAALAYHRGRLDPGLYQDTTFQPSFSFTLPPGWEGRRNYIDGVGLGRTDKQRSELDVGKVQTVFPDGCVGTEAVPIGRQPADLIAWLRGLNLLKTSNLRPINLGGYSGLRIDIEAAATPPNCPGGPRLWLFPSGEDIVWMSKGDRYTLMVLDVRGTPVTFLYGGAPAEGFNALAEPIVQSVRFLP